VHRTIDEDLSDATHYTGESILTDADGHVLAVQAGAAKQGDFRDPRWSLIENVHRFVGFQVRAARII
jgi:hypothetical protein